jgi:hypothetical protein
VHNVALTGTLADLAVVGAQAAQTLARAFPAGEGA